MGGLLAAFVAELGIITYRAYKSGIVAASKKDPPDYPLPLPLPADYVSAAVIFGALALLNEAEGIRPIPGVVGWALVIATVLQLFDPSGKAKGVKLFAGQKSLPPIPPDPAAQRGAGITIDPNTGRIQGAQPPETRPPATGLLPPFP